ncbi:hypothetical protein ACQP1O_17820 [Nocardia sp. CA-151230]|uniref:hypothetical protein n=1 Tax=Nocardia sp. CA-151230 TaxID=3239982 RepID=UPI003D90C31D
MVISHAAALISWIESALPELDPTTFGPWLAEPAGPGAVIAVVHVRVESATRPARSIAVTLSAHPITHHDTAS